MKSYYELLTLLLICPPFLRPHTEFRSEECKRSTVSLIDYPYPLLLQKPCLHIKEHFQVLSLTGRHFNKLLMKICDTRESIYWMSERNYLCTRSSPLGTLSKLFSHLLCEHGHHSMGTVRNRIEVSYHMWHIALHLGSKCVVQICLPLTFHPPLMGAEPEPAAAGSSVGTVCPLISALMILDPSVVCCWSSTMLLLKLPFACVKCNKL